MTNTAPIQRLAPSLKVGSAVFTADRPAVIVPLAEELHRKVIKTAKHYAEDKNFADVDVIEWRLDYLEDPTSTPPIVETLAELKKIFGDKPILLTLRTSVDGGKAVLSPHKYTKAATRLLKAGKDIDLIDVEYHQPDAADIIEAAHERGVTVVGSEHDFQATPSRSEMIETLHAIQSTGADIAKLAVTPQSATDVLTLFEATQMSSAMLNCPIITMSMGPLGFPSRISGGIFGSAGTFATLGEATAPGQAPVSVVVPALKVVHSQP